MLTSKNQRIIQKFWFHANHIYLKDWSTKKEDKHVVKHDLHTVCCIPLMQLYYLCLAIIIFCKITRLYTKIEYLLDSLIILVT